jgi:hypothetical protein
LIVFLLLPFLKNMAYPHCKQANDITITLYVFP